MKRLLDYDPLTGTREVFEATDDGFMIHTTCDVEPIVEANAVKRSAGRAYYAADKDMWKIGSIPNIMLLKWAGEYGIPPNKVYSQEFAEIIARRLNDPDYRAFKTADVRL